MSGWISLTVLATTVALGGGGGMEPVTEIELHAEDFLDRDIAFPDNRAGQQARQ